MLANNINVPMTRRFFDLPKKVALRDSKIAEKLIYAWDVDQDSEKVLDIFLKYKDKLSSQRYWEFLRSVWVISGKLSNVEIFTHLMTAKKKNRYCFSTPEESITLNLMKDRFTVYRACDSENDGGISWTYSKEYALEYQVFYDKKMVLEKEVNKSDVFALINRNKESEVIILPVIS